MGGKLYQAPSCGTGINFSSTTHQCIAGTWSGIAPAPPWYPVPLVVDAVAIQLYPGRGGGPPVCSSPGGLVETCWKQGHLSAWNNGPFSWWTN